MVWGPQTALGPRLSDTSAVESMERGIGCVWAVAVESGGHRTHAEVRVCKGYMLRSPDCTGLALPDTTVVEPTQSAHGSASEKAG